MTTLPDDAILEPENTEEEISIPTDFTHYGVEDHPEAQFIRIDLMPANAQFTPKDGLENAPAPQFFGNVRIILTDLYAYVFADGAPEPQRVLQGTLTGFTGSNREGYTAHFSDGTLYFRRAESCACGSRLRGIRPFPYVPQVPLSIF